MSQQPALKYSWNTMVASSFWDMRLSIACAATDAEFQNRIILHGNTLNLQVVAADMTMGVKIVLFPASSSSLRTTSWAFLLLSRPQLRIDPIQSSSRASTE